MKKTILAFFFSTFTIWAFAQTGTIRGTIKDAITGEDLIGATVRLDGTNIGAVTDVNGFFSIAKVPAGNAKLLLTYVSYKTKEIPSVTVEADKVTEVNTSMEEDKVTLAEVKVTAVRQTNTEVSVITEIKAAQQIVSGISAQQIGRTLDRDAAQVVRRVPGITIVGDRFINIRGLNQRYNTVMLHNAFTPSMETDVRAFSFDVIPSSQIDRLLVFKSPAAELPGEFAGGVVKIFTKSIPDRTNITLDYSVGVRAGTTFKTFQQSPTDNNYWTGFNSGYYDLPKSFPTRISTIANNPAAVEVATRQLKNNWVPEEKTATPDQRIALNGNFRINAGNIRIGNTTAINYSNTWQTVTAERNDYAVSPQTIDAIFAFRDAQYARNIRVGILHNWAVRFNENHSIEWKNLYNQISNGRFTQRTGRDFFQNYQANNQSFDQVYRGIYTGQLTGRHQFNDKRTIIDWVAGYNNSYRDQPDYRRFRSEVQPNGSSVLYIPIGQAQAFYLGRFYSNLKENGYTGAANLTQKIGRGDVEVKAGVFVESKDRSFNARNLGYVRGTNFNPDFAKFSITQLLNNVNYNSGVRIDESTNPNDSYSADNTLMAGYGSINLPFTKQLNLIAGVRVENNLQELNSAFLGGAAVRVSNNITSVLPSVNLTYNFSEKSLLRAAYGMTVNRPEFRELAPFSFFDFEFNAVYQGNPQLKIAQVQNVDLRYEFYPTPSEIVSVAAFYKQFKNPIEQIIDAGSVGAGSRTFITDNAASATSAGLELEVRKGLSNLTGSPLVDRMSLLFNAALITSTVKLKAGTVGQSDNRPLQGQSPYIINMGLNYNDTRKDLQINLLYNVIGKRIIAVGFQGFPDIYEMPRNVIDLTFSKGFAERWQIKGGIQDILNQPYFLAQSKNIAGTDSPKRTGDLTVQKFKTGQYISLGFAYTILNQ